MQDIMKERTVLPFYMTYPFMQDEDNSEVWKDVEYLQQMYPMGAKIIQNEINKIINLYDYRGSLIYDEYPDRFLLYRLGNEVIESLKRNRSMSMENQQYQMLLVWDGMEEFVMVLLFYEILKRRHQNHLISF